MKIIIIIPAYNPPPSFEKLICKIFAIAEVPILIIDDGSLYPIRIMKENTILLHNVTNRGKGYSLLRAFKVALSRGYTHAITMDADWQHDPNMLNPFINIDKNISIVIGKRSINSNMPIHRQLSNYLSSNILSLICKKNILDSQSGYRRYILKDVLFYTYLENGFQFESEVLIRLLSNNHALAHIDIPTIYSKEKSSINNIFDTFKFIRLIFRNIIRYNHKI